jgi:hypothetical protein
MSKRQVGSNVTAAIHRLLAVQDVITSGDVARAGSVSRQAAHYQLTAMVKRGELEHEGAGRGSRYRRRALLGYQYELIGLAEDEVWFEERAELVRRDLEILDNPKIMPLLNFTFTEMVNNAIDHSRGAAVEVRWYVRENYIAFDVADDGIGAFKNVASERGLASEFDSIGEIAKGKQTTAPHAHSGLGIYFTTRMASRFELTSGQLTWIVDNRRQDAAVEWFEKPRIGTLVRCEFDADTAVTTFDAFNTMSIPGAPGEQRSTIRVSLFQSGDTFVSRTEAKRLAAQLETFSEVEIDFAGVSQVGQGFIDELFRVWQFDHPETRLIARNTNPAIDALIRLTS